MPGWRARAAPRRQRRLVAAEVGVLDLGIEPDLRRRPLGDLAASIEHGEAIAYAHDDAHLMLDQENGDAERFADLPDERHHVGSLARIHAGGWLVGHQELWPGCERLADLEAALLTIGEIAGEDVAAAAQAGELQQPDRLRVRPLLDVPRVRRVDQRPPPS